MLDVSQPPGLRSIAALLLGSVSREGRELAANALTSELGEWTWSTLHALALKDIERGISLRSLREFWYGAIFYLADFGCIAPKYAEEVLRSLDGLGKNDPLVLQRDVDLPTQGFLKYLGRIEEQVCQRAVLDLVQRSTEERLLLLVTQLFPPGNEDLMATCRSLYVGGTGGRDYSQVLRNNACAREG